jgi:hypothetical protein
MTREFGATIGAPVLGESFTIVESRAMSWRDDPYLFRQPFFGSDGVLVVGDARYWTVLVNTAAEVRQIVRDGLAAEIEWLRAAGHDVG